MDTTPALSLHERILTEIEQNILSGHWPPGYRIPAEVELTEQYQCSRMTVNKVLTQLAHAGLVERRRRAGSFVKRPQSRSAVLEIRDIRAEVAQLGLPRNGNLPIYFAIEPITPNHTGCLPPLQRRYIFFQPRAWAQNQRLLSQRLRIQSPRGSTSRMRLFAGKTCYTRTKRQHQRSYRPQLCGHSTALPRYGITLPQAASKRRSRKFL